LKKIFVCFLTFLSLFDVSLKYSVFLLKSNLIDNWKSFSNTNLYIYLFFFITLNTWDVVHLCCIELNWRIYLWTFWSFFFVFWRGNIFEKFYIFFRSKLEISHLVLVTVEDFSMIQKPIFEKFGEYLTLISMNER
jgi:hypothetical protein